MPPETVGALTEALRLGRLLETVQQDELTRTLASRYAHPLDQARELVRRAWLTPFQPRSKVNWSMSCRPTRARRR